MMHLDVWMEDVQNPVGTLTRQLDTTMSFTYAKDTPPSGRLSLSMPIRTERYRDVACRAYFGNLLFEDGNIERLRKRHRIERDDYALALSHVGLDCPGAVSISSPGTGPGKRPGIFPGDYELLSREKLAATINSLYQWRKLPPWQRNPSPLAGVQPKLAILFHEGEVYLPREKSGAPTTHVLKVSPRDDYAITRNEAALLSLAQDRDIRSVAPRRHVFKSSDGANIETIIMPRFDRVFEDSQVSRIHVEDFAQAIGLHPGLKYERDGERMNHRFSAELIGGLATSMADHHAFRMEFMRQTMFNLLVGNTDNHAKNATVLYRNGQPSLAPIYDVVPVMMDQDCTHEFSFNIGKAKFAEDVTREDLLLLARTIGLPEMDFDAIAREMQSMADGAIEFLEEAAEKDLADAVAGQMRVVEQALGIDLRVPERDYFPRRTRDEEPSGDFPWDGAVQG